MWLHGDSITNNPGSFGVQGVPSSTNFPPSLYESCEWTDLNGNYWLFGGLHGGFIYSDLWKYNPSTNEWTWVKGPGIANSLGSYGTQGVPSPSNNPPSMSYGINSWVDFSGNLWLFGGASGGGFYSDLWKYEIAANEWTWIKGPGVPFDTGYYGVKGIPDPANKPPYRQETAASWSDNNGDFWIFGGGGFTPLTPPAYNDLWRYNIASNNWTWMNGSSIPDQPSVYGTKGVEDTANSPGSRWVYARWKDNSGYLWLYGGSETWNTGFDLRNDLWRFNPATNKWAWINGDTIGNMNGVNGVQCIGAPENLPSNAFESRAAWTDLNGNLWVFLRGDGVWNSLWMYCQSAGQWAIMKADSSQTTGTPVWGTKGVSSPSNIPPYLQGAIAWTDYNGHLYMFGGWWFTGLWSNALWMYTIDSTCNPCSAGIPVVSFIATDTAICPGTCIDLINNSQMYTGYQWQFPGGNPSSSSASNPQNICYPSSGNYDITLIATGSTSTDTLTFSNYITVFPSPSPQSITQSGDTLFALTGAASYQWYYNGGLINGATNYYYVAPASGDYNLVASDVNGCEVEAVIFNVIAEVEMLLDLSKPVIFPNPVENLLTIQDPEFVNGTPVTISIFDVMGKKIITVDPEAKSQESEFSIDVSQLMPGLYHIEMYADKKVVREKFVKQ